MAKPEVGTVELAGPFVVGLLAMFVVVVLPDRLGLDVVARRPA